MNQIVNQQRYSIVLDVVRSPLTQTEALSRCNQLVMGQTKHNKRLKELWAVTSSSALFLHHCSVSSSSKSRARTRYKQVSDDVTQIQLSNRFTALGSKI